MGAGVKGEERKKSKQQRKQGRRREQRGPASRGRSHSPPGETPGGAGGAERAGARLQSLAQPGCVGSGSSRRKEENVPSWHLLKI